MHYISFCSEGEPNDRGINLSNSKKMIAEILETRSPKMNYFFYTPKFLRDHGFHEFVKEYEKSGVVSMNPQMNLVGFCAWKPLIILLEMEKMRDGDIVIYRDCNCEKYGQLKQFGDDFEKNVNKIMDICKFDFFIPQENENMFVVNHVKSNVINDLAIDVEFTKKFPLLIANILICRKSPTSIAILEDWKNKCSVDAYINGETYAEPYDGFRWYTPEQGILSVLISNYVLQGKYGIPPNYPNINLENREINNIVIVDEKKKRKAAENFSDLYSVSNPTTLTCATLTCATLTCATLTIATLTCAVGAFFIYRYRSAIYKCVFFNKQHRIKGKKSGR
jgi:hypothetical protein